MHTVYFLAKVETKNCNVTIDDRNFLGQPVKNDIRTYENIGEIVTGQEADYTTGCLLDYPFFKEN